MPALPEPLRLHRRLRLSRRLRHIACWTIAATLLGLPVWLLAFANSLLQLAVFSGGMLLGVLAVTVVVATVVHDNLTAVKLGHPIADAPRWGLLLVLSSPLAWLLTIASDLPARLWLWQHQAELEQLVQQCGGHAAGEPFELDGHWLLVAGEPRALMLLFRGFAFRYGIAHDPGRVLPAHGRFGDLELSSVRDLDGPWRVWVEAD